jgi:hypothetical protein
MLWVMYDGIDLGYQDCDIGIGIGNYRYKVKGVFCFFGGAVILFWSAILWSFSLFYSTLAHAQWIFF